MILKIGQRYRVEVASLEEASRVYQRLRNESGEGGSTWPTGLLPGYHVSYNGRVWKGRPKDWKPGAEPVLEAQ